MDTARKRKLTRPKEEEAKEEKLLALTTKAGRGGWLVPRDTRNRNRSQRSGAGESVSSTGSTETIATAASGSSRGYGTHSDEFPTGTERGLGLDVPCTPCYPYAGEMMLVMSPLLGLDLQQIDGRQGVLDLQINGKESLSAFTYAAADADGTSAYGSAAGSPSATRFLSVTPYEASGTSVSSSLGSPKA
ncbi:hypothetical protein CKAN_02431500 [Cinnamomum micranthum f. kanehirae]|uniref:Uncharacterized protein n=1 Tax=Cinnamomum micranthum f. kanehirae TaxID=337451 RepID=A0A3S3NV26_9MAGN|nr:hypothetical protein CKAN_02431500 [Cinnamomum micranthum f. kanehirae]